MKQYEGVLIYPPESTPEVRKTQDKGFEDLVQKLQGKMLQKNEWGKKSLGYPLKKFREGFFVIADFEMDPSKMTEFRNSLELQEDLLKFMVTVKNLKADLKPPVKTPSAVPGSTTHAHPHPHPAAAPRP